MKATREGLGDALLSLGELNPDVVALDADLSKSTMTMKFARNFPDRFFECGVAEQNMMATAAGLAAAGKIPYTGSFAIFATGRAYEQVRNIIGYPGLGVKLCPTHAGITVGEDGASHQTFEDIALMRVIPGMTVIVPADYYEARSAIIKAAEIPGPVYIRLGRSATPFLFDDSFQFKCGKAINLRDGKDLTIVSCGLMTAEAVAAAESLSKQGIEAEVINVSTIKPFDEDALLTSASKTGRVITVEEHSIIGGLGSAVAEILSEQHPVPLKRIGIKDCFGTSGTSKELLQYFDLTADHIVETALSFVE